MPATPLGSSARPNATPTCAEPWALQTSERFGGYVTVPVHDTSQARARRRVRRRWRRPPTAFRAIDDVDRQRPMGDARKPAPPNEAKAVGGVCVGHGPHALPDSHLVSCAGLASPAPNAYQRSEVETSPSTTAPARPSPRPRVEAPPTALTAWLHLRPRQRNATPGVGACNELLRRRQRRGCCGRRRVVRRRAVDLCPRTDRFALPNSHYSAAAAAAPGRRLRRRRGGREDAATQRVRRQAPGGDPPPPEPRHLRQLEKEARLVRLLSQYGPDIVPPPPLAADDAAAAAAAEAAAVAAAAAGVLTVDDALTLLGAPAPARAAAIQEEEESEAAVAQALEELKEAPTPGVAAARPAEARPRHERRRRRRRRRRVGGRAADARRAGGGRSVRRDEYERGLLDLVRPRTRRGRAERRAASPLSVDVACAAIPFSTDAEGLASSPSCAAAARASRVVSLDTWLAELDGERSRRAWRTRSPPSGRGRPRRRPRSRGRRVPPTPQAGGGGGEWRVAVLAADSHRTAVGGGV